MLPSTSLQLGDTALTTASYNGNSSLVRMLLQAEATLNTLTKVMSCSYFTEHVCVVLVCVCVCVCMCLCMCLCNACVCNCVVLCMCVYKDPSYSALEVQQCNIKNCSYVTSLHH